MGKAEGNLLLPVLQAPRAGDHGPDSARARAGAQKSSYCRPTNTTLEMRAFNNTVESYSR